MVVENTPECLNKLVKHFHKVRFPNSESINIYLPSDWKWSWDRQLRAPEVCVSFHEVLEPTLLPAVKCKGCRHFFKHPSFYKKNAFSASSLTRHAKDCLALKRLKRHTQPSNDTS